MIKTNPKVSYCGLTVVVSNPSRFDTVNLGSANGGVCFNKHCLNPEFNAMQCEFRQADDPSPLRSGTKCVLLMGEYAMHKWIPSTANRTLNEMRGSPLRTKDGIPAIASFFYQDAVDIQDWEGKLNEESHSYHQNQKESEDENIKRFGATARSNYAFWLRADTAKCKKLLQSGGCYPSERQYPEPKYIIYPSAEDVIEVLRSVKDGTVDFDMETDYARGNPFCRNMQCFAFSVDGGRTIYSVPILDHHYNFAYTKTPEILLALMLCASRNVLVAHNGATFDFPVLASKYRIPVVRPWDTMISQHRIFPDVEKSLGHCVSLWLWEQFHKDENPGRYHTHDDMMRTLQYCAKDVYTMSCVRQEQQRYAQRIPGLWNSIETAQRALAPYLTASMVGIQFDDTWRQQKVKENDRLMMHYLKFIDILIGSEGMRDVQSAIKSKHPGAFPSSNPQTCRYFHDILGYKVQRRGKPRDDGTRHPSLAAQAMYKLRLTYENPVIDFSIAYRQLKVETSTPLGFLPWIDDSGKQPLPPEYVTINPTTTSPSEVKG